MDMHNYNNGKKLIITILLQSLMFSENLSYESKKIIYKKIINQFKKQQIIISKQNLEQEILIDKCKKWYNSSGIYSKIEWIVK